MTGTPRCLLIGYGYVARATARRLIVSGWRVSASARTDAAAARVLADGLDLVRADPAEAEGRTALGAAARDHDAVISSAPPVEGRDPVIGAFSSLAGKAPWLGYLSTTGVYGDRQGGWSFEWDEPNPGSERSRARAAAEAEWSALDARIFRLGGIYGPGRSALDRIREGGAVAWTKPGQVFGRIHVDDIASALVRAMERPAARGVFNLVDDWPSGQDEVLKGAAGMLGAPPPQERAFDPATASPMLASFYSERRRVSNARAKAVLGWRPAYPDWRDGLRAILASENTN